MNKKPLILVISGPSGVGKDTIISGLLLDKDLDFERVVTTTSRGLRKNEIDMSKYYHISRDEFEDGIRSGVFLEYELIHGNYYGATFTEFDRILGRGNNILYELDVVGMIKFRKWFEDRFNIKTVFIAPPSIEVLVERLKSRGTESQESIDRRIETTQNEMKYIDYYDHIIVNDILDTAIFEIIKYAKDVR